MKSVGTKYIWVALSFVGSAILLFSCGESSGADASSDETVMTGYSENLSIVESKNGLRSFHFETPLVEEYSLARDPYREFREGIRITTFHDDSLATVDAVLTANYAINYENRKLWEAKGDVVVEKSDGTTLYTQQLYWNQQTRKIYSNVDSKIVLNEGRDVYIGEGFESDEDLKDWRFRRMKGKMEVEMKTVDASADSTASSAPADRPRPASEVSGGAPSDRHSGPTVAIRRPTGRPASPSASRSVPQVPRAPRPAAPSDADAVSAQSSGAPDSAVRQQPAARRDPRRPAAVGRTDSLSQAEK